MSQTWQKACDCKGATATSGRIVIGQPHPAEDGNGFRLPSIRLHRGPVCDSCDTPWILASSVDTSRPAPVT